MLQSLDSCLLCPSSCILAYLFVAFTSARRPSSLDLRPDARRGTRPRKATSQRYSRLPPKMGFISGSSFGLLKPSVPMFHVWMKPKSPWNLHSKRTTQSALRSSRMGYDLLGATLLVMSGDVDVLAWDLVHTASAVSGRRGETGPLQRSSHHHFLPNNFLL